MRRYRGIKGKVWEVLSLYIRERDGWKCATCHRSKRGGYLMQAGHYHPVGLVGSNNTLSWDEKNIMCQCSYCNGTGQGMQVRMREALTRRHGTRAVKALDARVGATDPVRDWKALLDHYQGKLGQLRGK